jgi:hypothetical protein
LKTLHVSALPDAPLDAAAAFYRDYLPRCQDAASDLAIVLPPADHTHRAWRLAAIQELARAAAPLRVNAVSGEGEAAIDEALNYLDAAPGVTGQVLVLA